MRKFIHARMALPLALGALIACLALPMLAGGRDKEESIRWDDLPLAVKKTIQDHARDGLVKELEREVERGVVVYEAEIELKDGTLLEIEVAEDGRLLEVEEEDDEEEDD